MSVSILSGISYFRISFLTFQAVIQVVLVCFSGYVAAKYDLLDSKTMTKISKLNVFIFTPALIFIKLASDLSLKKIIELIIVPIFFVAFLLVSLISSKIVSRFLNFNEPETNYITALTVFGNSFSLPVSIIMSLAYTLPNLKWDRITNDNSDQIASRGILYLLIFHQLGQCLRWSWGYNTLMKKRSFNELYHINDSNSSSNEEFIHQHLVNQFDSESIKSNNSRNTNNHSHRALTESDPLLITHTSHNSADNYGINNNNNNNTWITKLKTVAISVINYLNPPLVAMIFALVVSLTSFLKYQFYEKNGFFQNTVSSAIAQLGSVSIPLVLLVLGGTLYPSNEIPPATPYYRRIIIGAIISRMVLPAFILLPSISILIKYFTFLSPNLSDPIFLIVAFMLTVAPPALQISQICQINEIYQKEMAGVLFWAYVVFTLPVVVLIVLVSLRVLSWANN
ncbi:auxin efflux carrier [Ascoidea rubescens DSM 1968]|uniref:Auxin efflux carrier n=1 Tax=Ascoidea rubescens DSM 1968 TaxID=1344418 RepID=A0A1D2VGQ5_9ASCO|nr:auxin efflux carrier [Ascoidea rubescens DSM 1968]ODV60779.1 auxin efflux carrier [Ascoidea rubescens DSM 1968]